jgi:hypothetical protein
MIDTAVLFEIDSWQPGFEIEVAAQAHFGVSTPVLKLPGGHWTGLLKTSQRLDIKSIYADIVFKYAQY